MPNQRIAPVPASETKSSIKAGGVVWRAGKKQIEVLLVTSRSRPGRWIFPKGSAEPGEAAAQTATREIHEEAGVRGELSFRLGVVRRTNQKITYFLFRFEEDGGWVEQTLRDRRWVGLREAERYLRQTDLHEIVERARRALRSA